MPLKRTYHRKKIPNNNPNTNPSTNNTYNNPINPFNNNPINTFNNNPINSSANKRKNNNENLGDLNHTTNNNNQYKKKMINSFDELQNDNNELTKLKKSNFKLQQRNISMLKYFDNAKNYIDYLDFLTSIINDFYEDSTNKKNFIQILETANTFLLEKLTDLQNGEKNLKIEIQNIQKNTKSLIVDQMIEYDDLINDLNKEKQNNEYLTEKNNNFKTVYYNIFKETIESKQRLLKSICENVDENFDKDIKIIIRFVFEKLINIRELFNKNVDLKNKVIILKAENLNNHTINDDNIENSSEYSIKISDDKGIQAKIYNYVNFIDDINNIPNNFLNSLDFNKIEIQTNTKNIEQFNYSELNNSNYIFMQEINKKMNIIKNIKFYIDTIDNITILLTDFLLNTKHENLLIKLNDESKLIKNKKQELKNKHHDFVMSLINLDQIQEENKINKNIIYISNEKLMETNNTLIEKNKNLNCIIENFKISLESKKQLIQSIYSVVQKTNIVSYNTKTKIDEIINELNNMKNLFITNDKCYNTIEALIDSNTLNINQIHELNNNFLTI